MGAAAVTVQLSAATRCDRCQRMSYETERVQLGTLCRRCRSELADLLAAFMRSGAAQ